MTIDQIAQENLGVTLVKVADGVITDVMIPGCVRKNHPRAHQIWMRAHMMMVQSFKCI